MRFRIQFEGAPSKLISANNYDEAYSIAMVIADEENCYVKLIKQIGENSKRKPSYRPSLNSCRVR